LGSAKVRGRREIEKSFTRNSYGLNEAANVKRQTAKEKNTEPQNSRQTSLVLAYRSPIRFLYRVPMHRYFKFIGQPGYETHYYSNDLFFITGFLLS
jgi:hypothetical protein